MPVPTHINGEPVIKVGGVYTTASSMERGWVNAHLMVRCVCRGQREDCPGVAAERDLRDDGALGGVATVIAKAASPSQLKREEGLMQGRAAAVKPKASIATLSTDGLNEKRARRGSNPSALMSQR